MPGNDALGNGVLGFRGDNLEGGVALGVTGHPEPPPHLLLAARPCLGRADVGAAVVLELESLDGASHDPPWFRSGSGRDRASITAYRSSRIWSWRSATDAGTAIRPPCWESEGPSSG